MPVFDVQQQQSDSEIQRDKMNFIAAEYYKQKHEAYFCIENNFWHLWDGRIYRQTDKRELMNRIAEIYPENEKLPIKRHREILENLERLACVRIEDFNVEPGISFQNIFLNTDTLTPHEHDKKRLVTIAIDYPYNPSARCPLWEKTSCEIFENDTDKIGCIQEFFGYCLSRDTSYKKNLVLLGESNTGKSVILETLNNMLGEKNVTAVSLKDFSNPQYLATLQGKLANISTETDPNVEQYETQLKIITSGERLKVKQVYERPYEFRPICKLIMAANELPHIADKSNAIYNRLLLVPTARVFETHEQDSELIEKLKLELPGILNWAIDGLKRLRKQKHFNISQEMIDALDELKLGNNPLRLWARDNISICPTGQIEKGEAYRHFVNWTKENGYKQLGLARFSAQFYEIFKSHTMKNTQRSHGTDRKRIWPGLAWRTETETKEEQQVWDE